MKIVLRTDRIVVCKIEETRKEKLLKGGQPIDVAFLAKTPLYVPLFRRAIKPANLLIALAEPVILPPVRWRARLDPWGFVMHRARAKPPDRERVIAELTRHGAEQTKHPVRVGDDAASREARSQAGECDVVICSADWFEARFWS